MYDWPYTRAACSRFRVALKEYIFAEVRLRRLIAGHFLARLTRAFERMSGR